VPARKQANFQRKNNNILPIIREIQASGTRSPGAIARALAARGIATARGGQWSAVQVSPLASKLFFVIFLRLGRNISGENA
jgi:hypothetical protein